MTDVNNPTSLGILPLSRFPIPNVSGVSPTLRFFILVRRKSSVGSVPVMRLDASSNLVRFVKEPISVGIVPSIVINADNMNGEKVEKQQISGILKVHNSSSKDSKKQMHVVQLFKKCKDVTRDKLCQNQLAYLHTTLSVLSIDQSQLGWFRQ